MSRQSVQKISRLHSQIRSLPINQSQTHIQLIQQLTQFQNYYQNKYELLKQQNNNLKQQNWINEQKLTQCYEIISKFQKLLHETEKSQMIISFNQYQETIKAKNKEINQLKKQVLAGQGQSYRNNQYQNKLLQENRLCQSVTPYPYNDRTQNFKQEMVQLEFRRKENEMLKIKIKHLENDKKYEEQRIKNATLALELDIQMKDAQLTRLKDQINIYQAKFKELLHSQTKDYQTLQTYHEGFSSPSMTKDSYFQPNIKSDTKITKHSRNFCHSTYQNSIQQPFIQNNNFKSFGQSPRKKIHISNKQNKQQCQKQKTFKKVEIGRISCHRRNLSSNLQCKTEQNHSQVKPFNMKIKVYRFQRNKKKVLNL